MDTLLAAPIRGYHWLLAISLALLAHSLLLINYSSEPIVADEVDVQKTIVISLKNLKTLPAPKKTIPEKIILQQIEPIIPKPTPITKPVKQAKKKIVKKATKAIIRPAEIAPLIQTVESKVDTTAVKSEPIVRETAPASTSGKVSEEIKEKYLTNLSAWLAQHKRYPKLAKRRKQEGVVKVKFWINEQGTLLYHELIKPSKYSSLNMEVEKMLKRASPMPPVPPTLRLGKKEFAYTIPIYFNLNIVN